MLYNDEFLMLHYPKTAGTSASVFFCRNFPSPIYGSVSPGLVPQIGLTESDGVHLITEGDHWNFIKASSHLKAQGRDTAEFKALLLPIRNPYDLMVSQYGFLRAAYERTPAFRERPAFKLAAETSFGEFCDRIEMPDFMNYLPPEHLKDRLKVEFIRFEHLQDDCTDLLRRYGIALKYEFPHLNRSGRRSHFAEAYDAKSKACVDQKLAAMFRVGGYPNTL